MFQFLKRPLVWRTFLNPLVMLLTVNILQGQTSGSVTRGKGQVIYSDLLPGCPSNHKTPLGIITSTDQKKWLVPTDSNWIDADKLQDLYNSCSNKTPAKLSDINMSMVPAVTIDPLGDTITAYLFCDNYFELYINGMLIGVDAVPFTPFNSSVAKFVVSKPYTIAVKLVDWEEYPGLGTEIQSGNDLYHTGDGGFIAAFSDGTVTDGSWKAQSFYIAPLDNPDLIDELPSGVHATTRASTTPACTTDCYGVHYDIPANWQQPEFDDKSWPTAVMYSAAQVTNQPAYTNFAATAWSNAKFIWSSNLFLDNVVLSRKQVGVTNGLHHPAHPGIRIQNPVQGNLNGQTSIPLKAAQLSISDISGKTVLTRQLGNMIADSNFEIDLKTQPLVPGIYLLSIAHGEGRFSTRITVQPD